jgi:hypothetical protein
MQATDAANRPRWMGQAGFFEIWFVVVMEPAAGRAWWLRWTTWAPTPGAPDAARATLWAAAFDAVRPAVAIKTIAPADRFDRGPADGFAVRIGDSELRADGCHGAVRAGGHAITWELRWTSRAPPARRGPRLLEHLPLPTNVAHAHPELACSGWVEVDGRRHLLTDAPGLQKHLWGTRRVEDLVWLFCPRFAEDPAARLEATAVRVRRDLVAGISAPYLVPVWAATASGVHDWCELPLALTNRIEMPRPGEVVVHAASLTRALRARAWAPPDAFAGYVYRDPSGFDLHVAQSDVASCEVELHARPHPLAAWRPAGRLTAARGAALEIHRPEPLAEVRYVGWDAEAATSGT